MREIKSKLLLLLLVIGIGLLIFAPVAGFGLDKTVLIDEPQAEAKDDSETTLDDCYIQFVTLRKDERLIIEFSVFYENTSATLIIVGEGAYKSVDEKKTAPTSLAADRLDFLYSEFARGMDPEDGINSADAVQADNNEYFYIEFMGKTDNDGSTWYLVSVPGDYVIIVYGNEAQEYGDKEFNFDIKISVDGPYDAGDILKWIFSIVGIILILAVLAVGMTILINRFREV